MNDNKPTFFIVESSKGNEMIREIESSKYRGKNYSEKIPRETTFASSYQGFLEIEGSRNRDSTDLAV